VENCYSKRHHTRTIDVLDTNSQNQITNEIKGMEPLDMCKNKHVKGFVELMEGATN
jgi:hypothetical protein